MGIYIRGMEKPKDCYNCNFNESDICCSITKGEIDRDDYTCEINCPLIEVTEPHGDLIDRDAIPIYRYDFENGDLVHRIDDVPVVIEAEGNE